MYCLVHHVHSVHTSWEYTNPISITYQGGRLCPPHWLVHTKIYVILTPHMKTVRKHPYAHTLRQEMFAVGLWCKMPMFQRAGMKEGELPQFFNIWFFWHEELATWIWSWFFQWLQNCESLNLGSPFFEIKLKTPKSWHFESSEDIMTKFKSQGLHIIRIKYKLLVGVAPSLPPSILVSGS